jgi:hypothetical protein
MSSQDGPNRLGYTGATMVITKRSNDVSLSKSYKNYPSSDCSLQLESMKEESLVIVNQHVTVNRNPNLVHTARHAKGICLLDVYLVLYKQFFKILCFNRISAVRLNKKPGRSRNRVVVRELVAGLYILYF